MKMQSTSFSNRLAKGIKGRAKALFSNPYKNVNLNWYKEKLYKHLPPGKVRSHRLFGKLVYFSNPSQFLEVLKEVFVDKVYGQDLPKRPYIIDCGANIGLSVIYLKHTFPDAEIVAFEPDTTNFDLITRNIQSFEYSNVTLKKEAVWKENTILHFSDKGSTDSKIEAVPTKESIEIPAVRLRDLLVRKVDFLKIDIEGAEYEVMKDLDGHLQSVRNLFVEYHGTFSQNNELCHLLEIIDRNGFSFYIKEATSVYPSPFDRATNKKISYDIQLNIFCFRIND
jgi:FkbM family methyltransferase